MLLSLSQVDARRALSLSQCDVVAVGTMVCQM